MEMAMAYSDCSSCLFLYKTYQSSHGKDRHIIYLVFEYDLGCAVCNYTDYMMPVRKVYPFTY